MISSELKDRFYAFVRLGFVCVGGVPSGVVYGCI